MEPTPTPPPKRCILDIEATSIHPWTGRIICIGTKDTQTGATTIFIQDNEQTLLNDFFHHFDTHAYDQIIGFNLDYDLRYLTGKAFRYKIPAHRFFNVTTTDLMTTLNRNRRLNATFRWGTLDEWSRFLLGKGKLHADTSIPELYRQRRLDEIIQHNHTDLELTFELWQLITTLRTEATARTNFPLPHQVVQEATHNNTTTSFEKQAHHPTNQHNPKSGRKR